MQNNNCKNNQPTKPVLTGVQFPSLGRAVENQMQKARYVSATLYHLDGSISQVVMTMPHYSNWVEYLEDGQNAMCEYINQMTRHWIKITHFFTEVGSLKPDGSFSPLFGARRHDIPVNKVYKSANMGEWVKPDQHPHHPRYNQRGSSMDLSELAKIVSERNEAVLLNINANKTLCGIPSDSRRFYFRDGDLPAGNFEQNGITYLVVYSFVKSDEEGGLYN